MAEAEERWTPTRVWRYEGTKAEEGEDLLAAEEPLEIRLGHDGAEGRATTAISITMRTPGDDGDLAVGFLFTEGIVRDPAQIREVRPCGAAPDGRVTPNVVRVELAAGVPVDLERLRRNFYTSSSCGVCGKTSLEAALALGIEAPAPAGFALAPELIHALPGRLRAAQGAFTRTGGHHAAGLFTTEGALVCVAEDVGRHNAVDKVVGREVRAGRRRLSDRVLVVSGRGGFELVQKALVAGIPAFVGVGAPSSLAVALAERHGLTLVGFAREGRFNVYAGRGRIG